MPFVTFCANIIIIIIIFIIIIIIIFIIIIIIIIIILILFLLRPSFLFEHQQQFSLYQSVSCNKPLKIKRTDLSSLIGSYWNVHSLEREELSDSDMLLQGLIWYVYIFIHLVMTSFCY